MIHLNEHEQHIVSATDVSQQSTQVNHNFTDSKMNTIAKYTFWTIAILFDPIIDFFTQGLSDFLGLETLRHGTSLRNYLSIRVNGSNPSLGGTGASVTVGMQNSIQLSKNYFFVAKDNDSALINHENPEREFLEKAAGTIFSHTLNRNISPRLYCGLASYSYPLGKERTRNNIVLRICNIFLNLIIVPVSLIFVPTVKFRFTSTEIANPSSQTAIDFEEDPENRGSDRDRGLAYKTANKIGTDRIGLLGIINYGLSGNIKKRMSQKPVKTLWGLIKLMNPIGIVILGVVGIVIAKNKLTGHYSHHADG
jgi:hypothetical protein